MLRLRPYKKCDSERIAEWIKDEEVFQKWGGERFGEFPIDAATIHTKYTEQNGDCVEEDNFYPWVAIDEDNNTVGHFIMRYTNGDNRNLRFGWVIVNSNIRGKGIGTEMLTLGIKYAFEILKVERITIGVFENNEIGHNCYKRVGFKDFEIVESDPWNVIEMEISNSN